MQSINITVINPVFMLAFMGTAAASLFLLIASLLRWQQPGSSWLLAACLLYLVGTFGVTAAFNVPLNDALAPLQPASDQAQRVWADYVTTWTLWNHVRTLAAMGAMACFIVSLVKTALVGR